MRRPYKADSVLECINKIKATVPELKIGTHIITGFPGETDKDFKKTLEFVKLAKLDFMYCYEYSEHKMADSARLVGKVKDSLKYKRYKSILKEFEKYNN